MPADLRAALSKTTRADVKGKSNRALGDIAYDREQWAEALKDYQGAVESGFAFPPATQTYLDYRMGAVLQAQGQWAKSEPCA